MKVDVAFPPIEEELPDITIIIRNCRLVTSDLAFFKESLKNLNGIGDVSRSLDDLWRKVNELRMNRGSPSTGRKNVLQR